jgi:hypothetical protein
MFTGGGEVRPEARRHVVLTGFEGADDEVSLRSQPWITL